MLQFVPLLSALLVATPSLAQGTFLDNLRKQAEQAIGNAVRQATLPTSLGGDFIDYDRITDYSQAVRVNPSDEAEIRKTGLGIVLVMHPGRTEPAVLERNVRIVSSSTALDFSARAHPRGDFVARVVVVPPTGRAEVVWESPIDGRNGWLGQSVSLARYVGQVVVVRFEAHATGWYFEHAGLDYFVVVQDGQRVPPDPSIAVAANQVSAQTQHPGVGGPQPPTVSVPPEGPRTVAGKKDARLESQPSAAPPVPMNPAPTAQTAGKFDPEWHGVWTDPEGNRIEVTAARFAGSGHRVVDGKKQPYSWAYAMGGDGLNYDPSKQWTPASLSRQYEAAVRAYKQDPTDFSISEPIATRRALQQLTPRPYRVLRPAVSGDCPEEYIVDRDLLLEIVNCKYGFSITPFVRKASPIR